MNCVNSRMKYIIFAGWIMAVVDATGIVMNDNGTECVIKCGLGDENKTFSYDSSCKHYVKCRFGGSFTISSCYDDSRYDEDTKKCVSTNGNENPVCHPCAHYPPYIQTTSDCLIDCHANKGKNISHSFDCKTYAECTDETLVTYRNCPADQTFSDAAGACVQPAEGADPTCHPCRRSNI